MTVRHIDLSDPDRQKVAKRATKARMTLEAARRWLISCGYVQTRFDQYQHPQTRVMVETGYVYGEARLVVHGAPESDDFNGTDFRLVGGDDNAQRYQAFKALAVSAR